MINEVIVFDRSLDTHYSLSDFGTPISESVTAKCKVGNKTSCAYPAVTIGRNFNEGYTGEFLNVFYSNKGEFTVLLD